MKLLGINFSKISCERKSIGGGGLKINSKIDISDIDEINGGVGAKEQLVKIKFKYLINYEPDYAKIELEGIMVISAEQKIIKNLLEGWKEKKISEGVKMDLFNLILKKSSIKALQLEEEMNLPYHMPFPSLKSPEKNSEKKE